MVRRDVMNDKLREELEALILYLKNSGADSDYKVDYTATKVEMLIKKYGVRHEG